MTLSLIVFFSFLVEAATGFGSMIVALTFGAMFFEVNQLLGWLVPVNMVLSAYLVARSVKVIKWRFLATKMLPLMAIGLLAGTLIAASATKQAWLKPAFGVFVMAVAVWQLRQSNEVAKPLPAPARIAALLGAGVIHGIFATGGPLAVFVSARELPEKAAFRGTLSALWLVLNALVMPRLVLEVQVTAATLETSALMLIPLGLGIGAGEWIHHRLAEGRFRVIVAVMLLIAGAVLLGREAFGPSPRPSPLLEGRGSAR